MYRLLLTKTLLLDQLPVAGPGHPGDPCLRYRRISSVFRMKKGWSILPMSPPTPTISFFTRNMKRARPSSPSKGYPKTFSSKNSNLNNLPLLTPHIDEASQQYGIDPILIQAVIHVESNFDPQALSPKGAQGLMQLMPQTARDLQVSDAFSPKENIVGGTRYLRYLLDMYNQDMSLALAAYNAGPEKVNLYRGIPPYQETRTYVQKVTQIYNQLKSRLLSTR